MMNRIAAALAELSQTKRCAIFYPLEKASERSDVDLLLSSLITENPSDETALELNWQQFFSAVDQLADQFAAQGLQAEDGIGLVGKNSLQLLLCYLAGLSLGARVMVINPQFPPEKIVRILQQNQLKFYLANSSLNCDVFRLQPSAVQLSDLPCANRTSPRAWQRAYTMTLTSGSSGDPKAVVHDLPAHWQNALGVNQFLNFNTQNSWLLSLPLYHVSGQGIVWRWLSSGACLHFSGEDFYAAIKQASHASLVPTQLQRYLDYLTYSGQSAVQAGKTEAILLGGAPIERALCERAQMVGLTTFSGYGMTEMASTVYVRKNDPQQPEMRLLQGRELTLQAGEIWVRGAGLARGYWQNGKIVSLLNSAGWYQTKDRGEWQNGELQVLGRIDNLFISGGENIQPEEIEAQLLRHPLIEQAVVLPQSDVEFGARPVALLGCSQPFSAELATQVRCWLQDKIERFKQPIAYYPLPEQNDPTQLKISRRQLQQALQRLQQKNDQE